MPAKCQQNANKMPTKCQQNANKMPTKWQKNARKMPEKCQINASKMPQQNASKMPQQNASKMPAKCQQNASKMSAGQMCLDQMSRSRSSVPLAKDRNHFKWPCGLYYKTFYGFSLPANIILGWRWLMGWGGLVAHATLARSNFGTSHIGAYQHISHFCA